MLDTLPLGLVGDNGSKRSRLCGYQRARFRFIGVTTNKRTSDPGHLIQDI